jgi:hypothetical protein
MKDDGVKRAGRMTISWLFGGGGGGGVAIIACIGE